MISFLFRFSVLLQYLHIVYFAISMKYKTYFKAFGSWNVSEMLKVAVRHRLRQITKIFQILLADLLLMLLFEMHNIAR